MEQKDVTKAIFQQADRNGDTPVKILEINSKTGLYPLYVTYSLYRSILPIWKRLYGEAGVLSLKDEQALWDKILQENVFVICNTPMAARITERTLRGFREVKGMHVKYPDPEKKEKTIVDQATKDQAKLVKKLNSEAFWFGKGTGEMKFNVIVGNPPYQEAGGSGGTNDAPIFQHFCEIAAGLSERYVSMIIPSRWFAAGRENLLGPFRKRMLTGKDLKGLTAFANSRELFSSVEIKGGICYYLIEKGFAGDCNYEYHKGGEVWSKVMPLDTFDILIRNPQLSVIVKKVHDKAIELNEAMMDTIVSADTPFGIPTNPRESAKTPFPVKEVKTDKYDTELILLTKGKRSVAYVRSGDITKNAGDVKKHKVFIPGAGGSGDDEIVLGKPEYGRPGSVCSQTFLYVVQPTKQACQNLMGYFKSRFLRALVSAVKITQHAQSSVYRFVPVQDFSKPWTDAELYKKYKLTKEEIAFIESMIKPMD